MIYDVAVLGGGASGMVCAIQCAMNGLNTVIIERNRIGKKLLVTGNGRCNLTNMNMGEKYYYSHNMEFVANIISRYTPEKTIDFFNTIGLTFRNKNGLIYPFSNKAQAVLDCLRFALAKYHVEEIVDFEIDSLKKTKENFIITETNGKTINAKKAAITLGLKAYNGTDTGIKILKTFGHEIMPVFPALVQLKSNCSFVSGLKGIKFIGKASAVCNNKVQACENGEVLFTDYGVSGIAILQLSHIFSIFDNGEIIFDFLPHMEFQEVCASLENRVSFLKHNELTLEDLLTGYVDKKLGIKIIKYSQIGSLSLLIRDLTKGQIISIAKSLKGVKIKITGNSGFKNAQVCGGGANLREFNPQTMESKYEKGLYAAGEVLDAVGLCGGYNLHWAWATGLQAARGIIDNDKNK